MLHKKSIKLNTRQRYLLFSLKIGTSRINSHGLAGGTKVIKVSQFLSSELQPNRLDKPQSMFLHPVDLLQHLATSQSKPKCRRLAANPATSKLSLGFDCFVSVSGHQNISGSLSCEMESGKVI